MEYSNASGQRAARSERINATPYRRPQPRASASPFSTVKNIISYALSPLFRRDDRLALPTTTQDVDMEPEGRSESGSEDNWDSPQANTRREDVFAVAAQYSLDDVEETAAEWQARGEIPGGRRDTARRSLATPTPRVHGQLTRTINGNASASRNNPLLTADQFTEEEEREIGVGEGRTLRRATVRERHLRAIPAGPPEPAQPAPEGGHPAPVPSNGGTEAQIVPADALRAEVRAPAPHLPPPAPTVNASPAALAAAATALATFIDGKQDQALMLNDWVIMDAMMGNIRAAATIGVLASTTALGAFLDGKRLDHALTRADVQLVKALTDNMKAEAGARLGGWSAGTPRAIRPMPNRASVRGIFTPAHDGPEPATPTSSTPVAVDSPTPFSSPDARNHRVTYLGPGMSPRRMLGKPRSSLGLRPLFAPEPEEEESATKKRRTEEGSVVSSSSSTSTTSIVLMAQTTTATSSSSLTPSHPSDTVQQPSNTLRHPLSQSFTAEPSPDPNDSQTAQGPLNAVTIGKKRAADIMRNLIREEVGPLDAPPPPEDIIINPYDTPRSSTSERSTPSPSSRSFGFNSPRQSVLRATLKHSPKRGAAAKLEATKGHGRQLTALEVLTGKKPWEVKDHAHAENTPSRKGKGKDIQCTEDGMDVDRRDPQPTAGSARANEHETLAQRPAPKVSSPQKRPRSIPEPEPFEAFVPPVLNSPSRPIQRYNPAPPSHDHYHPGPSFVGQSHNIEPPKFSLSGLRHTSIPDDPMEDIPPRKSPIKVRFDPTIIYFNAKDQALKIDEPALPFFTFTLPRPASGEDIPSVKEAKALALQAPLATFHFTLQQNAIPSFNPSSKVANSDGTGFLPNPHSSLANTKSAGAAVGGASEWTCGLCMLKNPASATEKCTICEAPKPSDKPVNKATTGSGLPAKVLDSDVDWTCSMCMLKNPGSAKEKCTICEEPRR